MQYLREQARESIKEYATEYLPEQYQVCLVALDSIIKRVFDIVETSDDNRVKLQAMEYASNRLTALAGLRQKMLQMRKSS